LLAVSSSQSRVRGMQRVVATPGIEQEDRMLSKTVEMLKQRQRRGLLPRKRSTRTVTAAVSLILLAAIIGTAALLSGRSHSAGVSARVVTELRNDRMQPVALLTSLARTHRFLFVSDVSGSAEPKLLIANALDSLALTTGLD